MENRRSEGVESLRPSVIERCLCEVLVEARLEKGMTQKDMAEKLLVHPPFVNKIEQADRHVLAIELPEIGGALGLSLVQLVTRFDRALRRAAQPPVTGRGAARSLRGP